MPTRQQVRVQYCKTMDESMKSLDYYKILGVASSAEPEVIKAAYRRLARKYHPDVSRELHAELRFKEVGEAYKILKDPETRWIYDQSLPPSSRTAFPEHIPPNSSTQTAPNQPQPSPRYGYKHRPPTTTTNPRSGPRGEG